MAEDYYHDLHKCELVKVKPRSYGYFICTLCGHTQWQSIVAVKSRHCSILICKKCATAIYGEFNKT